MPAGRSFATQGHRRRRLGARNQRRRRSSTSTARCCAGASGRSLRGDARRSACCPIGATPSSRCCSALQRHRREPAHDVATRQRRRLAKGWAGATVREAAELATPALLGDGPALRPGADRGAPGRRAAGGARHDHAARTWYARSPRPLGFDDVIATRYGDRRRHATTAPSTASSSGARARRRRSGRGPTTTASTSPSSYAYSDSYYDVPLLVDRGPPRAVNPDPRLRAARHAAPLADPLARRPAGRPEVRRARAAEGDHGAGPPRAVPLGPVPHLRRRPHPRDRPGDHRRATTAGTSTRWPSASRWPSAAARCASSARRRSSTRRSSATSPGRWAASGSTAGPGRTSRCRRPTAALGGRRHGGDHAAGHDPPGPRVLQPRAEGAVGGRARSRTSPRARSSRSGLWGTEKVWPRSSRTARTSPTCCHPPTVTVRVGRPVELEYDDVDADTARMMSAISALLPPEARERHEPTDEELARATPAGATDVDEEHEAGVARASTEQTPSVSSAAAAGLPKTTAMASQHPHPSRRRSLALGAAVLLMTTALSGCDFGRLGQRCRGTGYGHDDVRILVCKQGRCARLGTHHRPMAADQARNQGDHDDTPSTTTSPSTTTTSTTTTSTTTTTAPGGGVGRFGIFTSTGAAVDRAAGDHQRRDRGVGAAMAASRVGTRAGVEDSAAT